MNASIYANMAAAATDRFTPVKNSAVPMALPFSILLLLRRLEEKSSCSSMHP